MLTRKYCVAAATCIKTKSWLLSCRRRCFVVIGILSVVYLSGVHSIAVNGGNNIGIASFRKDYDESTLQKKLLVRHGGGRAPTTNDLDEELDHFIFGRYQSSKSIQDSLQELRGGTTEKKFKYYKGKDGRTGYVSTSKIPKSDWVVAESQQVAYNCTTQDVLNAYLSGELQAKWNSDKVINCTFTKVPMLPTDDGNKGESCSANNNNDATDNEGPHYYQQDLVLHSQRVITSHTGIMRYSQSISIDQIGPNNYCAHIRLIEPTGTSTNSPSSSPSTSTTTKKKPFNKLQVYVNLEQHNNDVHIYAAGIMKVNRLVVPNLVVFDASGIAGTMAGKGTLWLNAYFDSEQLRKNRQ